MSSTPMNPEYVSGALSSARNASTFALQMLRDQQEKLELAQRMYRLWQESGHTQEAIAEAIGLKHRSYQKALQTGGISYERLKALAAFHGVDFGWLLRGDKPKPTETPDLAAALNGNGQSPAEDGLTELRAQVAEVNRKLDDIGTLLDAMGEASESSRELFETKFEELRRALGQGRQQAG